MVVNARIVSVDLEVPAEPPTPPPTSPAIINARIVSVEVNVPPEIELPPDIPPEAAEDVANWEEFKANLKSGNLFDALKNIATVDGFLFALTAGAFDGIIKTLSTGALAALGFLIGKLRGSSKVIQVAGQLSAKKANSEQINAILKSGNFKHVLEAIRNEPKAWAKFAPKLTKQTQAVVSKALINQHPQVGSALWEASIKAFEDGKVTTSPAFNKLLAITVKGTPLNKVMKVLATIAGIDVIMSWLASDNIITGTSFFINKIVDNLEAGIITKEEATAQIQKAQDYKDKATEFLETSTIANPLLWLFRNILLQNADLAQGNIDAIKLKVGAGEFIETEEDKWERIRQEQEARRDADRIEEEEFFDKIQQEADERKAQARVEDQAYFDNLRIAAEERAADRRIEEAEQWEKVQAEAELTRIAEREEAEEYWARVNAENDIRKAAEAAEWERRLQTPPKATITFTTDPELADLYVDGEYTFTKTPSTQLLLPGEHIIRVQKDGFFPVELTIEVLADEQATIPLTLNPIPADQVVDQPFVPSVPFIPGFTPPFAPEFIKDTIPAGEVRPLNFNLLNPPAFDPFGVDQVSKPTQRELLVNIETTDVKPWKGRIFSIAFQDLSVPGSEPMVMTDNDEKGLIEEFIKLFDEGNYARFVGFKTIFDYRYICNKIMLYRLNSRRLFEVELRDVKQLMDQIKESFVYFPDKTGTLDDYGKELLGRGKLGKQELLLRRYLAGDFDYVNAFQANQIAVTRDLYDLYRFASQEAVIVENNPVSAPVSNPNPAPIASVAGSSHQKQCKNCLAFNPLNANECVICKERI